MRCGDGSPVVHVDVVHVVRRRAAAVRHPLPGAAGRLEDPLLPDDVLHAELAPVGDVVRDDRVAEGGAVCTCSPAPARRGDRPGRPRWTRVPPMVMPPAPGTFETTASAAACACGRTAPALLLIFATARGRAPAAAAPPPRTGTRRRPRPPPRPRPRQPAAAAAGSGFGCRLAPRPRPWLPRRPAPPAPAARRPRPGPRRAANGSWPAAPGAAVLERTARRRRCPRCRGPRRRRPTPTRAAPGCRPSRPVRPEQVDEGHGADGREGQREGHATERRGRCPASPRRGWIGRSFRSATGCRRRQRRAVRTLATCRVPVQGRHRGGSPFFLSRLPS